MSKVDTPGVRARGKVWRRPVIESSVYAGEHCSDGAVSLAEILRRSYDGKIRRRIERRIARARYSLCESIEHSQRQAVRKSSNQFGRAYDLRRLQRNSVTVNAGELWSSPDATTVVKSFAVAVHRTAIDVEAKQSATRDKEWAALVKERFI